MTIELKKYRIMKSLLRNELREKKISLEISYEYKCATQDDPPYDILCTLNVQIYVKDNRTSIEQSPFYISAEFEALFTSSSTVSKDEATSETLRLLFPFVQAYIVQLTAGANMQPLKLPYASLADIKIADEPEVEHKKPISKTKKLPRAK